MTPEELAAIRDYYDNTCLADEIEAAFNEGRSEYHEPTRGVTEHPTQAHK